VIELIKHSSTEHIYSYIKQLYLSQNRIPATITSIQLLPVLYDLNVEIIGLSSRQRNCWFDL